MGRLICTWMDDEEIDPREFFPDGVMYPYIDPDEYYWFYDEQDINSYGDSFESIQSSIFGS